MDILSIVFIFFCLGRSWEQEQIYVVSAPNVFYVGASENVVIQVHGYTKSFPVTIAVNSYPDRSFTYSSDQVNLSLENKFQSSASLTDPEGSEVAETRKTILPELPVFVTSRFHLILSILNDLLVQLFLLKAVKVTGLLNSLMEPSACD
ncbi:hypothetical protein K5549_007985 [Capra hircus]|nr:hypothetical protein K5549_007985 [Capra hircus]